MLRFKQKTPQSAKSGFTIIELLVIAPVVILTIGAFITAIVSMTGDVLASRAANVLTYNIQDALNRIEDDVKLSSTFLAENSFELTSPQGYDDGTAVFENTDDTTGDMLIMNTLATTGNPLSASSGLVYLANLPNACTSTQVNQNTPMTINVIYFVKNDSLWRRTVMPSNYETAGCNVPWQQPSCAPTISAVFCKAQDIKLVEGVTTNDFVVQYFDTADATTTNSVASDASEDPAVRATALQSVATVGVSINVNILAGGREVAQSGAIRATKLDINASTIAPVVVATTPSAPTVSTSVTNPTSVVASWPAVAGAESYTVDYNINGGAWTNGFTNQNTTTYTVTSANHRDTVNVRVRATNTAGTSGYGTSSITIPLWANFNFQNNWTNYGPPWASSGYTKTNSGLIVLQGLIKKNANSAFNEIVAVLPPGYRPSQNYIFQSIANSANVRVDILVNGEIHIVGTFTDLTLNGISFMPSGTSFTNTAPPYLNGWVAYGDASYTIQPSYTNVGSERTELRAMISSGTTGTPAFTLPASNRPPQYAHLGGQSSSGNGTLRIDASNGNVDGYKVGNGWYSIHSVLVNSSRASGSTCTTQWCTLTLQSGWVHYGAPFSTVEYTKTADGMVYVKGFIKSGTVSYDTIFAQLPAGYRPSGRLLFEVQISDSAVGRVDVEANGNLKIGIASNVWLTLDGISFMAEQ